MMPEMSDYWRIPSVRALRSHSGTNIRGVDLTSFGMSKDMTYPNRTLLMCTNLPDDKFLGSWRTDATQESDRWSGQQQNGVHTQVYPECFSQFLADRLTESLSSRRLDRYDGHHCPLGHLELIDDISMSSDLDTDECQNWLSRRGDRVPLYAKGSHLMHVFQLTWEQLPSMLYRVSTVHGTCTYLVCCTCTDRYPSGF